MKDFKTNIVGFVLIAVGAFLILQTKKASPEAIAVITTGAGFFVAADSKTSN